MKGVKFGDKHTFDDFGLVLSSKTIELPEPKLDKVDVFGMDGELDLTNALSDDVKYKNRNLSFVFTVMNRTKEWLSVLSKITNYLHGNHMKIILDDDRSFYYEGRCLVNSFRSDKRTATIQVDCDVYCYKMDIHSAGEPWIWDDFSFVDGVIYPYEFTVEGTKTVNLPNRRKIVSPTFIVSNPMTVTFGNKSYSIQSGASEIYDIRLQEGNNFVTITGNGTVKIQYKGGSL